MTIRQPVIGLVAARGELLRNRGRNLKSTRDDSRNRRLRGTRSSVAQGTSPEIAFGAAPWSNFAMSRAIEKVASVNKRKHSDLAGRVGTDVFRNFFLHTHQALAILCLISIVDRNAGSEGEYI